LIRLRDARADDVAFVVGLVPRFVEYGAADGHTPDEVITGTERVLREAIASPRPGDVFLIAEGEDGTRAGFIYAVTEPDFFTNEPNLHVSELTVTRSGAGVGAALMGAAERWAREHGYGFVSLNVVEGNAPAERFYERLGYEPGHRHYVKRLTPET
jgi:GNAT superfamily N-acetyltransferase